MSALPRSEPVVAPAGALEWRIRWPVLERLLDPLPELLAARLRSAWGLSALARRSPCLPGRAPLLAKEAPAHALFAIFEAEGETGEAVISLDPVTVFAVLEFMLGNRAGGTPPPPPERPCSPFETHAMRPLAALLAETLAAAVRPAGTLRLTFRRWTTDAATILDEAALAIGLGLSFGEARGAVSMILPLTMLRPLSGVAGGMFRGVETPDPDWRRRLERLVSRSEVSVDAVLHRQTMPLRRLEGLKPGDTLLLDCPPDPPVALLVGTTPIGQGRLGHAGGRLAIRLDAAVNARKDAMS